MKYPQTIAIDGQIYKFVKSRRRVAMAVYKGPASFLRIGTPKSVGRELAIVKRLEQFGFPIPKIIRKGTYQGMAYYLEKSQGSRFFSDIFGNDFKKQGVISETNFKKFLAVSIRFAQAQLRTVGNSKSFTGLATASHFQTIQRELPRYKKQIQKLFSQAKEHLFNYPFVFTHGDFTSHNLFPKGVIDFEDLFIAPAGYDLVTAIFTIEYFPNSLWYEFYRSYTFTPKQKQLYLQAIDKLYKAHNLPEITPNLYWFQFCRAMWLTARNHSNPRLQKYRYKLFIKQYLQN